MAENEITKKKKLLPGLIIALASVVILVTGVVLFFVLFTKGADARKANKQVELGDRYLTDLDYDNAILSYKEAINLNPACEKAYLGLVDAYHMAVEDCIGRNEIGEAIDYLDDAIHMMKMGVANTDNEEIKDALDEFKEQKKEFEESIESGKDTGDHSGEEASEEASETEPEVVEGPYEEVELSSLPNEEEYMQFLYSIDNYDCTSYESFVRIISYGLDWNYEVSVNVPGVDAGHSARVYAGDKVDWKLREIYHADPAFIERFKAENPFTDGGYTDEASHITYWDGNYVRVSANIGSGDFVTHDPRITSVQFNGVKYRIEYDDYGMDVYDKDFSLYGRGYAVLEYKTIDGANYWTVYEMGYTPEK